MAMQGFLSYALPSRQKPQLQPSNSTEMKLRGSQDGVIYTQSIVPTKQVLADEGSYFCLCNPTPGTAIAYGSAGTQATFVDTVPFVQIINTGNPGDPNCPIVFVDYIKLFQNGTAPASTTAVHAAMKVDNGFRTSTAGTPTTNTPVSSNMNLALAAPVSRVVTYSGAVATIPAASAAGRLVGRAQIKGGPTLNLDEYVIGFGVNDAGLGGGYLTTVASYQARMPPVAVGPGQSATLHLWFLSGVTNPFSYEFEMGLWER